MSGFRSRRFVRFGEVAIGEGRSWTGVHLAPADADRILRLLADHAGEVVTRDSPRISATLPETGERFQGACRFRRCRHPIPR